MLHQGSNQVLHQGLKQLLHFKVIVNDAINGKALCMYME